MIDDILGQGLALPLEQAVAGFCALELALHQAQRLTRRENSFPVLREDQSNSGRLLHAHAYTTSGHFDCD